MRVAFPHIGNVWVALKAALEQLDIDYVLTPFNTRQTLSLGVKYAPEGLCLPFKITLGNFVQALEAGADTLLMVGGTGICRLGKYARVQEKILIDLGYRFKMINFDVSEKKLIGLLDLFRKLSGNTSWLKVWRAFRFGLSKLSAADQMEKALHWARPRELNRGEADQVYKQAIKAIDGAQDYAQLKRVRGEYLGRLLNLPIDKDARPLLVGVMGEIYVVLEPFSNLDIERELGRLGVEVRRAIFLSRWTNFGFLLNPLGVDEYAKLHKAAKPYLARDVGGDGWESVGEKALYSNHYDGLVHLAPFTCMPETVAMNIFPSIKNDLPVLTILCDEQMGKAGIITRLEAFVDLLKSRRRRKGY